MLDANHSPYSTRVISPQPQSPEARGLLIPVARHILDGQQRIMTPDEFAKMRKESARTGILSCTCGAPVHFVGAHIREGSFEMPNHFTTNRRAVHAEDCGYHKRKAARDFETALEQMKNENAPPRLAFNMKEEFVRTSSLGRGKEYAFERNENGLAVPKRYKDRQSLSIKSMQEIVALMEELPLKKFLDSAVFLNGQTIKMREMLLTSRSKNWANLFKDVSAKSSPLRLLALAFKKHQGDLFEVANQNREAPKIPQIQSAERAPNFVADGRIKSFALNPLLENLPQSFMSAAAQPDYILMLTRPHLGSSFVNKKSSCFVGTLILPVNDNFIIPISPQLFEKIATSSPALRAD